MTTSRKLLSPVGVVWATGGYTCLLPLADCHTQVLERIVCF